MKKLKIALIQSNIVWKNAKANHEHFSSIFSELSGKADVFVLPEMFNSGFCMNVDEIAETMNGTTINWLKAEAKKHNAAICGSMAIKENNTFFNRFVWIFPNSNIEHYDKKYLFSIGKENSYYKSGEKLLTIEYKEFKIRPFICYDLRFPTWTRNSFENEKYEYDLMIFVANWPQSRISQWQKLLAARAIENQSFVVAVNRTGTDGNELAYNGNSVCLDYLGNIIQESGTNENSIIVEIDKDELSEARSKFKICLDWDKR